MMQPLATLAFAVTLLVIAGALAATFDGRFGRIVAALKGPRAP
jgi:hypothetical protein